MDYELRHQHSIISKPDAPLRKRSDVLLFEMRNLIMKETLKSAKKINRRARARKILQREKGLKHGKDVSDDDSDISSEECEDNEAMFALMGEEDRRLHLINLWKKAYLKGRAGA
jgi:hypothetical protein